VIGQQALISSRETETEAVTTITGQLLITYEWSDWRNGNFWWIKVFMLSKHSRPGAFFERVQSTSINLAKARKDVCGLRLYVDAHNNAAARKTYERLGMKRTNYELF